MQLRAILDKYDVIESQVLYNKAVELLQGLVTKDSPKTSTYTPRQLFKKFED